MSLGCARVQQLPSSAAQQTPSESAPASTPAEGQLGAPYYPGAKALGGGDTQDLVNGEFTTPDSIDKVVSFYKGNIPGAVATGDNNETMIEFKKGSASYTIDIHRNQREGVTLIQVSGRK
jgi:hypothetical protein